MLDTLLWEKGYSNIAI